MVASSQGTWIVRTGMRVDELPNLHKTRPTQESNFRKHPCEQLSVVTMIFLLVLSRECGK